MPSASNSVDGPLLKEKKPDVPLEPPQWTGKTRGGIFGNWVFLTLVRFFGLLPAYALLVPVAFYFTFFAPTARKASNRYRVRVGYGEHGFVAGRWAAFKHFYAFGVTLLDRIAILKGASGKFHIAVEGENEIRQALARGKGLVLTGAHCGNWEIAAHLLGRLDVPVNILIFEGEIERVQRFFDASLSGRKFNLVGLDERGTGSIKAMQALAKGEVVAVLGDRIQDGDDKNFKTVPFLGSPARFPIGPHVLAAISGAGLIHAFAMRTKLYHYKFYIYPAEYPELTKRSNRQEELNQWVTLLVSRVEKLVRKYPLQWNNFFDFWQDDLA